MVGVGAVFHQWVGSQIPEASGLQHSSVFSKPSPGTLCPKGSQALQQCPVVAHVDGMGSWDNV